MVGELTPLRVDPSTADAGFWKRFHELRRVMEAELDPDDPVQPDEVVEVYMKKPDPFDIKHYFEMSRGGEMISWLTAESSAPVNPEYATNKHLFWANAYVRPYHRRTGVARRWLPVIAQVMREHGCTVAGTSARHEPARGFLQWLGAEPKLTEIESRLKLSEVDWAMVEGWVHEAQERSPQTRLEVYDGPLPDAMLEDFAAQRSTMLNTIPFEDLEIGEIIVTPERIRRYEERSALAGELEHEVITREPDGTISGMTDTSWAPHRRKLIWQQFTGVLPSARGRGIGKWIKAAMLLHLRGLYPDAEWIATGNAQSNDPMLSINRRLGFKPYRTSTDYQIGVEKLETKIQR
jgi:GNAT superfamily N-acetyltransferase